MTAACSAGWVIYTTTVTAITILSRADEIKAILQKLGADEVYARYSQDGETACVLAYFPRALTFPFIDKVADAVGTDKIDIGRDCVRVWV